MLVIADAHRSVALAGIMGGLNTEMTDDTTTVLLESANFDPITHAAHVPGPEAAQRVLVAL